jgi:hypothetical protein
MEIADFADTSPIICPLFAAVLKLDGSKGIQATVRRMVEANLSLDSVRLGMPTWFNTSLRASFGRARFGINSARFFAPKTDQTHRVITTSSQRRSSPRRPHMRDVQHYIRDVGEVRSITAQGVLFDIVDCAATERPGL